VCGIAGIFAREPDRAGLSAKVVAAASAIHHRGPDGSGVWADPQGHVALAHARLAIIDLTDEGKQPMISRSGNLVLTFNGEIYNYIELRRELLEAGSVFRGTSDTEVLLEAMERWGIESVLSRARGMFALGVWDVLEQCLWLARDRVGKKPLYIYENAGVFLFASEIKGILAFPGVRGTISQQSLSDYLSLGYVVGPRTIYSEISQVNPGTLVRVGLDPRTRSEKSYWRFPDRASTVLSPGEIEEGTEAKLREAIGLRLRSDVPVGIFLSGGIDSGLITALAAGQTAQPLHSFTVSFGADACDESDLARLVACRYGTNHHEFRLDPDLEDLLPKVVRSYDQPFADPSAFPTYAICAEASKHVKVVLNGEGADELFGGYRRIYAMRWVEKLLPLLGLLPRNSLSALADALRSPKGFRNAYSFLHRFLRAAQADPQTRYLLWSSDGFDEEEKRRLGLTGAAASTAQILQERMSHCGSLPPLAEFMAMDFLVGMADCLLPKIDIATMAHGLEGRSPFLDHELVEWVVALDKSGLLAGRQTKPVLRAISRRYLPPEVVSAPKRGFEIPLVRWMKSDLHDMVRDVCTAEGGLLFELFDRREVLAILERRVPMDDARWARRVWTLFMLASWGRQRP
jgi:asparagine synthase (glutamine-hydrolysing)